MMGGHVAGGGAWCRLSQGARGEHESDGMSKKLYVGNLPFSTTDDDLEQLFSQHGNVVSARVITDRDTGRSRGFGFVEMDSAAADDAARALDGSDFGGRTLRVNEARERGGRDDRRGGGRGAPRRY